MSRQIQMVVWIIATVVGVAGVIIIARATVIGTDSMLGILLLGVTAALLLITTAGKPGRNKGDTPEKRF